jgi:hypothetical protein
VACNYKAGGKAFMFSGKVVKGIFGKISEQPDDHLSDSGQNLLSHHNFTANGEHHEYNPVSGWVIRQNVERRISRFNYESLSAMH